MTAAACLTGSAALLWPTSRLTGNIHTEKTFLLRGASRLRSLLDGFARRRQLKPEFLGIGVQKGGTTSLYNVLKQHRKIFLSPDKEVHYFSNHFDRRLSWYLPKFRGADSGAVCGEITPYYVFHPAAPSRIHQFNPSMKLILLLRDPVERAVSHYHHAVRWGMETLPLIDALHAEDDRLAGSEAKLTEPGSRHYSHQHHSYVSRSRYERQIANYLKFFPSGQILVLQSERFFRDGAEILSRIYEFLDVGEPDSCLSVPKSNAGSSVGTKTDSEALAYLQEKLESTYVSMNRAYGFCW